MASCSCCAIRIDRSGIAQLIAEGLRALDRSATGVEVSVYHLQAEIASCHAVAATWAETDWPRIASCYRALEHATASPIVTLNRVIAEMQVQPSATHIAEIEALAGHPQLGGYHLLPAVLAELWREAGDRQRAAAGLPPSSGACRIGAGAAFFGRPAGLTRTVL